MSATIYPFTIGPIREPRKARDGSAPGQRRDPVRLICSAGSERIGCTRLRRDDPVAAADYRIGGAAAAPITAVAMLHERRGFLTALGSVYGFRSRGGFRDIVYVPTLEPSNRFLADLDYRLDVLDAVARTLLAENGFIALRPMVKHSRPATPALTRGARQSAMRLCRALGATGFAQLCDDTLLDGPPPLFVRPWCRERGLLVPRRLPRETYSDTLCVKRLGQGRMVLFERA